MVGDVEVRRERIKRAVRQISDGYLELAQDLVQEAKSGEWRGGYASFEQYVDTEYGIVVSLARELKRVQRTLEAVDLDPARARNIGWEKLKRVATKLHSENRDAVIHDLESDTLATVRQKYCPVRPSQRTRPAISARRETACCDRATQPDCGAADHQSNDRPDAILETSREAGSAVGPLAAGPKPVDSKTSGKAEGARTVEVTEYLATALSIVRRQLGNASDQDCLKVICGLFITLMGSESEKEWIRLRLLAGQAKTRSSAAENSPVPSQPTPLHSGSGQVSVPTAAHPLSGATASAAGVVSLESVSTMRPIVTPRRKQKQQRRRRRH